MKELHHEYLVTKTIRVMQSLKVADNLDIEPIIIHPRTWGIETIKQKQNEKT